MADLVIRINGDVKNYQNALKAAKKETEELSNQLGTIAKVSAVAFAALTAEIALSVVAFAESEAAANKLTTAMQNQGIYSKDLLESYQAQADKLSELTGISDEAIVRSQATLQGYLGEIKVTEDLTTAIADLAAAKGMDLEQASQLVGKAIDGNVGVLKRYGVEVADSGNKQENLSRIIRELNADFKGQAEAAAQGLGVFTLVKRNFGELQEEIGKRFAPAFEVAGKVLNNFLLFLKDNKVLIDWVAGLLAFGAAASGLTAGLASLGVAFLALKALLVAAGVAMASFTALLAPVVLGIAAVSAVVALLATNWRASWTIIQATLQTVMVGMSELLSGFGKMLQGAFTLDSNLIKEGFKQARDAMSKGLDEGYALIDEKQAEHDAKMEKAEADKREKNKERHMTAAEEDKAMRAQAVEALLAENEEYEAMSDAQKALFREKNLAKYQEQVIADKNTRLAVSDEEMQDQIKAHNKLLVDKKK
jgi:hypothetical protein